MIYKNRKGEIKVKKQVTLLMALALCLSLCACGGETSTSTDGPVADTTAPETYYQIGDTVSTNLFNFTLDAAELAIALENTYGENFGDPKEYNPQEDSNNIFVAPTGHTYVAFTYTVENVSRTSEDFQSFIGNPDWGSLKIIYKDKEYTTGIEDCAVMYYQEHRYLDINGQLKTNSANRWYAYSSSNLLVGASEKQSRKAYADFAVEVDSLTDEFYLCVRVPSSEGSEVFTYYIPSSIE